MEDQKSFNDNSDDQMDPKTNEFLQNSAKIISERFVPGASLMIDGKITEGVAHAALGYAARAVFGIPGMLVFSANSFSKSMTGKNLVQHAQEVFTGEGTTGSEKKYEDDFLKAEKRN